MWHLEDDSAVPPLPPLVSADNLPHAGEPLLSKGCWFIRLDPVFADDCDPTLSEYSVLPGWTLYYRGTLRVESYEKRRARSAGKEGSVLRASGDLYVKRKIWYETEGSPSPPEFQVPRTIPIFPIDEYAYYFTVNKIEPEGKKIVVTLATYRFHSEEGTWSQSCILKAELTDACRVLSSQRPGPSADRYRELLVRNERGTPIGELKLGRIEGNFLRKCKIDVAVVKDLTFYEENDEGKKLAKVFADVQWEMKFASRTEMPNKYGEYWKESILHAEMLRWRSSADLDAEWIYHVLAVPRFRKSETFGFGRMYDWRALDSNLIPREGVVVANKAKFPDEDLYGSAAGKCLEDVQRVYFHNLVHELGHAMGLSHRFIGAYFVQGLIYIARDARPGKPFPDNLEFFFHPEDAYRLRHYPDIYVRPGGLPFAHNFSDLPVPEMDATTDVRGDFELKIVPTSCVLPLGSPLKFHLRLTNTRTDRALPAPEKISLSEDHIAGRVIGPGSEVHPFVTAKPVNGQRTRKLGPGESIYNAETLLRGPGGALLPSPGRYTLEIDVFWHGPGGIARITERTDILVTEPKNARHAKAAFKLLGSREISIPLIFRTPWHLLPEKYLKPVDSGLRALKRALKTKELRPYYAASEAKHRAELGEEHLEKAAAVIDSTSVLTATEIESLLEEVQSASETFRRKPMVRRMVAVCHVEAKKLVSKNLAAHALRELAEEVVSL